MTDYLEELLDNTEAFLEQVRRLERGASGAVLERAEEEGSSSAPSPDRLRLDGREEKIRSVPEHWNVNETAAFRGSLDGGGDEAVLRVGAAEGEESLEAPEQTDVAAEERGSVLLEELERLERAAAPGTGSSVAGRPNAWEETGGESLRRYASGLDGARRAAAYPNAVGTAGESWTLGTGFAEYGTLTAGDQQWAERADRAFRRDSRRYDGGFYLY